ncbi:copper resistance system multicopper oxidase [Geobacter sp. DSM 9736]|uniref:copper resistance system multicopper oxidase n=1 Tax=Geobacter sp. DSM 9736 TaxID=1277350 RepID=UPI000B61F95E|nr:copper resistance system multicopper oxidase [Geobacter sp. DSM 9736]SNB45368.1 copper-resistance protein, CopA family [Geobacter sp. DSM 9736]
MNENVQDVTRRKFLRGFVAIGTVTAFGRMLPPTPVFAATTSMVPKPASGPGRYDISVHQFKLRVDGEWGNAVAMNASVPGPLLRFREGEEAVIRVTNMMPDQPTSVHWHGILLPHEMDGVPGVSFAGIAPGETFTYRFTLKQSGTYWYHSHSAFQEQSGQYGPLIIDPREPEPFEFDREYVVMLSDWTFEKPEEVYRNLKKEGGYYNYQKRTMGDFIRDAGRNGFWDTVKDRLEWGKMQMDPTDLQDVTGATYTYLINGLSSRANWTGLFRPGEKVRLRFINASAASIMDIRIPGLPLTVVLADGQYVEPVTVEEFRIAVAETYDVIVEPKDDRAYTIFAESMDRSGYARGTLAPREGVAVSIPERRKRPVLTMADMGMVHNGGMDRGGMKMPGDGEAVHGAAHDAHGFSPKGGRAGAVMHGPDRHGPGNAMVAMMSRSRLDEPGTGLENMQWRVLTYSDLRALKPFYDTREPEREIELHLTGNMERFIWSINGKKYSDDPTPIRFRYGERLRVTFVNDTMMEHPMHLHGMWMILDNGNGPLNPLKHTINVKAAERLSFLVTADAPGDWAFHCHILYHMEAGMFRVVSVSQPAQGVGE